MNKNQITNILSWVVTILAVGVTIFVLGSLLPSSSYKVAIVRSGSMEPSIKTGSLVVYGRASQYRIGDVIAFPNPKGTENIVTIHRVIEKNEAEEDTTSFVTRGDNNEAQDQDPVELEKVLGRVWFAIPMIGYAISWVKVTPLFLAVILVPISILFYHEGLNFAKKMRKKRAQKEIDAE